MNILVVEDDRLIQRFLKVVLESDGYQVVLASNGSEALAHLRSAPALPDLIMVDCLMPVMDGAAFRAHLAADDRLSSVPLLLMSASEADRGSNDEPMMLVKPVSTRDVLDAVAARLAHGAKKLAVPVG